MKLLTTKTHRIALIVGTVAASGLIIGCGGSPNMGGDPSTLNASICGSLQGAEHSEVSATVGGVSHHYSGDIRYTAEGEQRSLQIESFFDGSQTWSVDFVTPTPGTYGCDDANAPMITLVDGDNNQRFDSAAGDCEVTVIEATEERLVGRFSAILQNAAGTINHSVTDGCFTVVFDNAILDADLDGLSDADDGCPFDSTNSCDANINSCDADEQA
jgi:hypothetical protein